MRPYQPVFTALKDLSGVKASNMANKAKLTNAPKCPVHNREMRELAALLELTVGRGITQAALKQRNQFNNYRRYRCVAPNCPYVQAVPAESTD